MSEISTAVAERIIGNIVQASSVALSPDGRTVAFEIDEKVRENLINGWDDIALTLLREEKIELTEPSVLKYFRDLTLSEKDQDRLRKLVNDLGSKAQNLI